MAPPSPHARTTHSSAFLQVQSGLTSWVRSFSARPSSRISLFSLRMWSWAFAGSGRLPAARAERSVTRAAGSLPREAIHRTHYEIEWNGRRRNRIAVAIWYRTRNRSEIVTYRNRNRIAKAELTTALEKTRRDRGRLFSRSHRLIGVQPTV